MFSERQWVISVKLRDDNSVYWSWTEQHEHEQQRAHSTVKNDEKVRFILCWSCWNECKVKSSSQLWPECMLMVYFYVYILSIELYWNVYQHLAKGLPMKISLSANSGIFTFLLKMLINVHRPLSKIKTLNLMISSSIWLSLGRGPVTAWGQILYALSFHL